MHRLLRRQLKRTFGEEAAIPDAWQAFVEAVDQAYHQADEDRALLERSLDLTSQELMERNARLRAELAEREKMKAEAARLKAFYENTLNEVPVEIVVLDREGRYLYINPAAVGDEEMRRWLIGKTDLDYARKRGRDLGHFRKRRAWILRAIESKELKRREETMTTSDGEEKYYLRVVSPVLGPDGGVEQAIGYSIDLTDRKRFEEQLIAAKEEAEEMSRLKTSFLNNMSHEIRTPLASILGFADVLNEEVSGEHREFADLIRQAGRRLQATLTSVLDLARLESENFEMQFEVLDVGTEVREGVRLFRPQIEDEGLELRVDVPEATLRASLDEAAFGRVLSNLMSNAIKFTESGYVSVDVAANAEYISIRVEDTGIGISEAFLPHLFDDFRQASGGLSRSHNGSGLGLSITKHLVTLMEGTIEVDSEDGHGSTFTVTFPHASPGED